MTPKAIVSGVLIAGLCSADVLAASDACLQHSSLEGWKAVDDSTLEMTDTMKKRYIVRLAGRCMNVTRADARLVYGNWTFLGCLMPGEKITVTVAGLSPVECSVAAVQSG